MERLIRLLRVRYFIRSFSAAVSILLFIFFISGGARVLITKYEDVTRADAEDYLRTSEEVTNDILTTLEYLNSLNAAECTSDLLYKMHMAQYKSRYVKDIGFTKDNKLICTTGLGVLEKPFDEPKPQFTTERGTDMWVNVPLKLFNFEQLGTVAKSKNFNVVINASAFENFKRKGVRNALFVKKYPDTLTYLQGDLTLNYPEDKRNKSWCTFKGFYTFECSENSIVCSMSFISITAVLALEEKLIFGITMLSMLSALFIGIFINNYLNMLIDFKNRFKRNIKAERILCYYQPVVNMSSGKTIGCEVLVRWQDDDGTVVTPDKFLDIIKKEKRTEKFTNAIVSKAFTEMHDLIISHPDFKMAFNIFPTDFKYNFIRTLLEEYKIKYPKLHINIELTEDELVEAPEIARDINRLREDGYYVSIDDFGTGYSSLSYLQEIMVDFIKIDRSFVKDLEIGTVKSQLIPHIVSIAGTINASIIVEGVENKDQLTYLNGLGIQYAQGYYYSRPLPLDEFIKFIS